MGKFFNTAEPNQPDIHYTLAPKERINWPELAGLIAARKYYILHAPRQTSKTSLLINLSHLVNAQCQYRALYVNIETAQAACNDVVSGVPTIVSTMGRPADSAHLLIFNRDPTLPWDEKIYCEQQRSGQRLIQVWGL